MPECGRPAGNIPRKTPWRAACSTENSICRPRPCGSGRLVGAVSARVSIGGGSLTVPFLHWQSVDIKKAIGTSSAVGFPIAVAGTLGYAINGALAAGNGSQLALTAGFVYLPAAVLLACGSYFLAPVGAAMAQKLDVAPLKRIFGLLLLGLGLKMLFSVL